MSMAPSTLNNGHGTMAPQPWRKESVRAFFEGFAWSGQAPATAGTGGVARVGTAGSMMTMAVSQFFDTIAWDGQPMIGVPIAPIEAQPDLGTPEDSLTLDGFSDLFG